MDALFRLLELLLRLQGGGHGSRVARTHASKSLQYIAEAV
jgi:hypothetical protein